MKELWKANPFHLMNSPFAEMSYNSSGLNIAPERLLLATRRPSTHYPLASGAAFFDPLRATCRRATNHLQHTANIWRPPASHLPSFCAAPGDPPCTASAISLRAILWPLRSIRRLPASHLPASSPRDTRQPIASHPSSHGAAFAISPQTIRHRTAQHPPTPARHPLTPCRHLPARTDALNGPQNKPSARAGALNPRKNTFCVIVNCPLQIKPVFYFLFTSIASPAHRIRVKSSLLRLGRSCLALPFTHLGKDIT